MTRLEIETDILAMMGLLDTDGVITASTSLRTYIVNKIQAAHNSILNEGQYSFRRKKFSVLLKASATGTINITKLGTTGTVTGQTPDDTWIGGHVVISGNGFPLRVASYAGSVLTFTEPILAATNSAASFTMYFDGVLAPTDCGSIKPRSMKLAGHHVLAFFDQESFDQEQGYLGLDGTDYGFWLKAGISVVATPDVSQPTFCTTWGQIQDSSNISRRLINVYPFPDQAYALSFDGWKKPSTLSATSSVSEIPEEFHQTVLLPLSKLMMTEFSGFELSESEKKTLRDTYTYHLAKLKDEYQEPSEVQPFYPSSVLQ